MPGLTIPNTINNGDALDASQVMGNFTAIASWANANTIRADGGVAMTAPLTLSGAPTASNHAARKAYVDGFFPVVAANLASNAVQTVKIVDGAVTDVKLHQVAGSEAVVTNTIRDLAVATAKIADGAVTAAKLRQVAGSEAVVTAAIRNNAVTQEKIATNAVTHVERLRGASLTRTNGSNQTVTSGNTSKIGFSVSDSDSFTGGVSGSGGNTFTLPSGYAGDYSVLVRLTFTAGSAAPGEPFGSNVVINNGQRDYVFPIDTLSKTAVTVNAVVELSASNSFYAELVNNTGSSLVISSARLEVRQLS
jgi:hypothetical protein